MCLADMERDRNHDGRQVWFYRPKRHKNAWRGHDRCVMIGPKAQAILAEFVRPAPADTPIFSPEDAERRRLKALRSRRTLVTRI